MEDSEEIVTLDSKDVMDVCVVEGLRMVKSLGQQQYQAFIDERLGMNSTIYLSHTIPKNKKYLFGRCTAKKQRLSNLEVSKLKVDNQLFTRIRTFPLRFVR